MQWYYPPQMGADLCRGFDQFDKHDDSGDEHLDSLLKTIMAHEQEEGKKIDAQIVTWRGMMTKVCKRNSSGAYISKTASSKLTTTGHAFTHSDHVGSL